MPQPYVQDPHTGESRTAEFLELFLDNYANPVQDLSTGAWMRPIHDKLFGATPVPQQALYDDNVTNPVKRYIGRASRVSAGHNVNEALWAQRADIKSALQRLDQRSRHALAYRYCWDYSDETIAEVLGVHPNTVSRIIKTAFKKAAAFLDRS